MAQVAPIDPDDIRPLPEIDFDSAVRKAIDKAGIPKEATVAFVGVADLHRAKVAVMIRGGKHWSFSGYLEKPWKGAAVVGAQVTAWR